MTVLGSKFYSAMKNCLSLLVLVSMVFIYSCKKENNSNNGNGSHNSGGNLVRIQQGVDPDITNDTVYLISYTDTNHIASIVDSVNSDTLFVTTNSAGNPLHVTETYGFSASYVYDDHSNLTQLDYIMAGSHEQDVFEYTGGVLSKRTHNSNLGSGGLKLQGSFTYTFTNGNITDIKEFDLNGTFVQETTCSYGSQPNDLRNISLINLGNILGAEPVFAMETWFNKDMQTAISINGGSISNVYTLNSNAQPAEIVSRDNVNNYTFTWNFLYQ